MSANDNDFSIEEAIDDDMRLNDYDDDEDELELVSAKLDSRGDISSELTGKNDITLDEALQKIAKLEEQVLSMREIVNKKARTYKPEIFVEDHKQELREVQSQHYTNLGTVIRLVLFPNALRASYGSRKPEYKGAAAITVPQMSDRQFDAYMKTYEKVLSLIVAAADRVRKLGFDGFDVQ